MLISEALRDPRFFRPSLEPLETWNAWRTILKAADGEPLTDDEAAFFESVSGGRSRPVKAVKELIAADRTSLRQDAHSPP